MRIGSFFEEDGRLQPLEIEMAVWPGLPNIHFVGRADPQLKESAVRIKSAIKAAGFSFPVAHQILVNLAPTHVKKTSRGLELAVALLYLWHSGQLEHLARENFPWVYGELGLDGRVLAPGDLSQLRLPAGETLLTGSGASEAALFSKAILEHLGQSESLSWVRGESAAVLRPRPAPPAHLHFTEEESRLLEVLGVTGCHALFAGPAGTGKSSLARAVFDLMPDLGLEALETSGEAGWRPLVEVHHSTPRMAMIGGGSPPRAGEIARAHGGLLLMDEFLEFETHVLESMRETFEKGELRVGRLGGVETFRADAQILGTTNLCPCGEFVPGKTRPGYCRFSRKRCTSYSERLSGPLLDRFQILHFTPSKRPKAKFGVAGIQGRVRAVHEWQMETRGFPLTRRMQGLELWQTVSAEIQALGFTSQSLSERRRVAVLRVARGLADMEFSKEIRMPHMTEALSLCVESFQRLNRWQFETGN